MIKILLRTITILTLFISCPSWAENDHEHHEDEHEQKHIPEDKNKHGAEQHDEHTAESVELSLQQQQAVNIVVIEARNRQVAEEILAPGEVKVNAYKSSNVTTRIVAQVVKRHVKLGQQIQKGQVLATLSSVEMAEAQGQLFVADREWKRIKELGRKVVSGRRYVEAQVGFQQAYARVIAFGMTKQQASALLKRGDASKATGQFELQANIEGTVISDKFVVGEIIEPGRVLFEIADESSLWVEARLIPEDAQRVAIGNSAQVSVKGKWITGEVVQAHHALDEVTRTLAVIIEVVNDEDSLHPGLFVDCRIQGREQDIALVLPESALVRSPDGDWVVFIESESGRYQPVEIKVLRSVNSDYVVSGLNSGTRVVTEGAFFLQSELAKGGFDIHNH